MILTINMLLKKLIKNLPKLKKNIKIKGITTNSKKVQKKLYFFFFCNKEATIEMVKNLLIKLFKKELLLLFVQRIVNINIKTLQL